MLKATKNSKLSFWLGLFLTFSIALIKGGVPAWVSLVWVGLCCIGFIKVLSTSTSSNWKGALRLKNKETGSVNALVYFFAFQGWVLFQHITIARDIPASLNQMLVGTGMMLLIMIWYHGVRHPTALTKLYKTLILFTLIQSIYGLWIFLSSTNLLLWMPKIYYLDRPTGFFVNANHFAAYLVLAIVLFLSNLTASEPKRNQKNVALKFLDYVYSPKSVIIFLLLATLIATKSAGAMTALAMVLVVMGVNSIIRSNQKKTVLLGITSLAILILILILALDYSTIENEISGLSHTFSRRVALSEAAFGMLKDTWLLGVGGGSFYSQFSQYRNLEIGNTFYNYAHNDLLQFWIEYGLVGVSLLLLFIATIIRDNVIILSRDSDQMNRTFAYGSIYCTLAISVHSLVDFPLHIPGFSVCYLIIISVNSLSRLNSSQYIDDQIRKK